MNMIFNFFCLIKNKYFNNKKIVIRLFLFFYSLFLGVIFLNFIIESSLSSSFRMAFFIAFSFLIVGFFILRSFYFVFSNYVFLVLFFVLSTYITYEWGVGIPAGFLFYILVIIAAGILVGSKSALLAGVLSSGAFIFIAYLETNGGNSLIIDSLELSDFAIYPIIFGVMSVAVYFSNFNGRYFLKNDKNSFNNKEINIEKIAELSRLAEFGRLSSGFFHDLINPLTAVCLNVENIKNNKNKEECISGLVSSTSNMNNFVMSVRRYMFTPCVKKSFSVIDEIKNSINMFSYKIKKSNITVNTVGDSNINIYGSVIRFNQVIMNLLANAIDSYDKTNTKPKIDISLKDNDKFVSVTIRDYGVGMNSETRKDIFKLFFTTKNNKEGIGVGLFLVKKVIENEFKGSIYVDSSEHKGSEFKIRIPLY